MPASRARLIRLVLTESMVLSGIGAVLGIGIAFVSTMLQRKAQVHQQVLSDHMVASNPLVQQYLGSVVPYKDNFFAALNAAVKGLARPLAAEGLRINAVASGNILFPGGTWDRKLNADRPAVEAMLGREVALGRLGTPQEIAALTVFLASPRASFITGTVLVADGGQLR